MMARLPKAASAAASNTKTIATAGIFSRFIATLLVVYELSATARI